MLKRPKWSNALAGGDKFQPDATTDQSHDACERSDQGNQDQKGTCLYHLFQDNVQPIISASDADIVEIFEKIVRFSTVMIY